MPLDTKNPPQHLVPEVIFEEDEGVVVEAGVVLEGVVQQACVVVPEVEGGAGRQRLMVTLHLLQ